VRIGLIIYGNLRILTGGYIYDDILIRHLRRQGHRVAVFSRMQRRYWRNLCDNCFERLVDLVVETPPDLLLQDGLCHPSLFGINRRLKRRGDFPIVALVHQVLSARSRGTAGAAVVRWIETRYLKSVDAVIANSHSTQRAVEALVGNSKPALVAVPGGDRLGQAPSEAWIVGRARKEGPLGLVFLANVLPDKGLHRVLEDLSELTAPIWQLTVVGDLDMDPSYVDRIMTAADVRGLAKRVHFSGARNGAALAKILNTSHVLVLPYSHEAFGIAFVEGMAFGLPAVGSTAGAARETIRHGHNGFLIHPADRHALTDSIRLLAQNRDRLERMSLNAYATFRQKPNWAAGTAAVEAFLGRLIRTGPGPPSRA
jgi:glycosyltransferase involved in cell wall biosynthesis